MNPKPKTADEIAAEAAEQMFKSGGRSAMVGQPITQHHAQAAPTPEERAPTAEEIAKAQAGAGGMPTTIAAATGGFTSTAGGKVLDKADKEEEEEEEEEEGEEEAEKGKACKSEGDVDEDALMKSMDALDAAAAGVEEPEIDRRAELAKALEDGTLSDEDRQELMTLLGADQPAPASDAIHKSEDEVADESMDKGFEDVFSEEFSEDYDVSPFLEKFGTAVGAGLDIMREDLAKSAQNQTRFNAALAKSFRGVATVIQRQGEMIKSLAGQNQALAHRLGIVEQQPVGRKSAATPAQAQPIQKSFAGQEPDEIGLSREQIFQGLHLLMQKHKNTGGRAANGEPIDRAVSSYELSGRISKSLLAEVKSELSKSQQ
jgi:hypothetical protein